MPQNDATEVREGREREKERERELRDREREINERAPSRHSGRRLSSFVVVCAITAHVLLCFSAPSRHIILRDSICCLCTIAAHLRRCSFLKLLPIVVFAPSRHIWLSLPAPSRHVCPYTCAVPAHLAFFARAITARLPLYLRHHGAFFLRCAITAHEFDELVPELACRALTTRGVQDLGNENGNYSYRGSIGVIWG